MAVLITYTTIYTFNCAADAHRWGKRYLRNQAWFVERII